MGLFGAVFGVVGGIAGEIVKDATGIDVTKEIDMVRQGRLDEAIYDMRGDMEGAAYSKFRTSLRALSDEDFMRIDTDRLIDVQMRAYKEEKRRRRL